MKGLIAGLLALMALGVLFFFNTAQSPTGLEMTEAEKRRIQAEVDSLTNEWWEAWKNFDWDRGLSFVEEAPETTWTGAGQTVYSVAEMREVWPPTMAGLARQDLEFTNARTVVLAPEIVWTLREGDYVLFDTAGVEVAAGQFNETAVWVKRQGEWKVLLGHDDDTTPTAEVVDQG
jgi:hypothetical protein